MSSGGTSRKSPRELRQERRHQPPGCFDHLLVAPLFVVYEANFGTLARTCDAVGACMVLPRRSTARAALAKGNTLRRPPHVHWVNNGLRWLAEEHAAGTRVVAVEQADGALRLADVEAARVRTVVVLGHEHWGIPDEAWPFLDDIIEIPMIGTGSSLNVAVAGSLALYKLAGLA